MKSLAREDAIPPLFSGSAPSLRVHVSETVATLREVVLMPRDIGPVLPETVGPHDDVVVLLHGFFASAGVFRPMKERLVCETGVHVSSFTHAPGAGVERIAQSLARLVARIPDGCRIHLVGHSLGGLVARWYVQELGGYRRVAQTISLGSPFGGTERARPFRFLVGADLCRTSPLLSRLRSRAHEHDVPHTSIVGDADTMVVPAESAIFPRGDVHVLPGRGHNSLLFDPASISHVTERVRRFKERVAVVAKR
ncbi:MAG: alpha/beta fold hydrolase [Polyangiaceae bacterium]|nr:alpha/beta fold hydrolase [Polyangiaceae bacterium]